MKRIIYQAQFQRTTVFPALEWRRFLSPSPHVGSPQLSIQPLPYIYVKHVKSLCVPVCRCISNSPPSSSLPSNLPSTRHHAFHLAASPYIQLLHKYCTCSLMKLRTTFLCRSSLLQPVLSQLCEEGVRREE